MCVWSSLLWYVARTWLGFSGCSLVTALGLDLAAGAEVALACRCAMCHRVADEPQPGHDPDNALEWGRNSGSHLGKLLRIRVSVKQRAWVHEQCAWWSPEVSQATLCCRCLSKHEIWKATTQHLAESGPEYQKGSHCIWACFAHDPPAVVHAKGCIAGNKGACIHVNAA